MSTAKNGLLFVTTELAGVVPGGAGTVVDLLARDLVAAGEHVQVLFVGTAEVPHDRPYRITAVAPTAADLGELPAARGAFVARSRAAARGVRDLVRAGGIGRIEFHDFDGLGFASLVDRKEAGLVDILVTVRVHGPITAMSAAMGVAHEEWETAIALERGALGMADLVVAPSAAVRDEVVAMFDLDAARTEVSRPPVPEVPRVDRDLALSPEFIALGRLGEVKGSHDLLAAAVTALRDLPGSTLRFIGADGWSIEGAMPMRAWLERQIPVGLRGRVVFEDAVDHMALPDVLRSAWAVVVPSRYESFCLVAHEVRAAGLPVVVADLPAYRDLLTDDTGALVFDGTHDGLAGALTALGRDRDRCLELGARPLPTYGDPLAAYVGGARVTPRPERAQAGRATASGKRLESTLVRRGPRATSRIARAALRYLPESAATAAVRVVPQRLKDRFRGFASWPEENERRERAVRSESLDAQIAQGEFPELDAPEVSIVIPVYNQGAFVRDAIASVFEQTATSWEIVVVDDGSDETETLRVLAGLDLPRTRVIRQENAGLPVARNVGMEAARGRYVVPLDADDELAPTFIERLRAALESVPDAAFAHCWAELFGDVDALWCSRPFNPYLQLVSNGVIGCVLLRRDAWAAVGGYDAELRQGNEDWDLWLRLQEAGYGQVEVRAPLFRYRKHGVSMSVTTEARYEQARAELVAKHPDLYAPVAVRSTKRDHAPTVSLVVSPASPTEILAAQDLDDAEVVSRGPASEAWVELARERGWPIRSCEDDEGAVVAELRGTFVLDVDTLTAAAPGAVRALVDVLAPTTIAVGAVPNGWPHAVPLLWRRWSLLDGDGPAGPPVQADVDLKAVPSPTWTPGRFPTSGYALHLDLGVTDRVIQRQRPEEDVDIPAWMLPRSDGDGS